MHENTYATLEHALISFMIGCFEGASATITLLIEWEVVTWNVRGTCSPYILWKTLLSRKWDILCAVEHKCHELVGLTIQLCGYDMVICFKQAGNSLS